MRDLIDLERNTHPPKISAHRPPCWKDLAAVEKSWCPAGRPVPCQPTCREGLKRLRFFSSSLGSGGSWVILASGHAVTRGRSPTNLLLGLQTCRLKLLASPGLMRAPSGERRVDTTDFSEGCLPRFYLSLRTWCQKSSTPKQMPNRRCSLMCEIFFQSATGNSSLSCV